MIRKINPGLTLVQKALFWFSGELIFGGAYYWREFCVSKWVGLNNKNTLKHEDNCLKQLKLAMSLMVYGIIFGRAYYQSLGYCV